jgi:hypothetical protein
MMFCMIQNMNPYSNICIGTDLMHSKLKKQAIIKNNSIVGKHRINKKDGKGARHRVSKRALTSNEQCPMRIRIYLNYHNHWYISSNSCPDHKHHPKLEDQSISLSQSDMSKQELRLLNVLYDVNVPPSKISTLLDTARDDNRGTFLQKTLFNVIEKRRNLMDVANGILPTCSDAEKTLKYLHL